MIVRIRWNMKINRVCKSSKTDSQILRLRSVVISGIVMLSLIAVNRCGMNVSIDGHYSTTTVHSERMSLESFGWPFFRRRELLMNNPRLNVSDSAGYVHSRKIGFANWICGAIILIFSYTNSSRNFSLHFPQQFSLQTLISFSAFVASLVYFARLDFTNSLRMIFLIPASYGLSCCFIEPLKLLVWFYGKRVDKNKVPGAN